VDCFKKSRRKIIYKLLFERNKEWNLIECDKDDVDAIVFLLSNSSGHFLYNANCIRFLLNGEESIVARLVLGDECQLFKASISELSYRLK